MDLVRNLFSSTIGRKLIMAVTGVVLIGFIVGHLVGNLQIFEAPDRINGYATFLQSLGPVLWAVRIFLLICVGLHIWAGTILAIQSRRALGDERYAVKKWLRATVASRYMRWTGYIVLAFLIYHIAQFTLGLTSASGYKGNLAHYTMKENYHVVGFTVVPAGANVLDVRTMMIRAFSNPVVSLFYMVSIGLLSVHLLHGAESLFQTLGWRNHRWAGGLRAVVWILCAAYFLGNLAIPGAVLLGVVK